MQEDKTTQVDKSKKKRVALEESFVALADTVLVAPKENEAKVKAALEKAKKLLQTLRNPVGSFLEEREEHSTFKNANITEDQQRQIDLATEQFKQAVIRVDNQILAQYIQAIQSGDYAEAERILENAVESQQTNTLMFAMLTIGAILLPLYARQRLSKLFAQFGLSAVFANTEDGQKAMREQAEKGAASHVQTIARDLKTKMDKAIDEQIETPAIKEQMEDKYPKLKDSKTYLADVKNNKAMYKYAQDLVLKGASRDEVIKKLQEEFPEVSRKRANVIAGNEANRIFTMSQYEADAQFLAQNKLTNKAYKRLVSNTGHPCPICKSIITATHIHPIPFKKDFAEFGKEMVVEYEEDGKQKKAKFTPNYERLKSGHIHVNCHCRYELVIKRDDGTFFNSDTNKVEVDFKPDLHPRDKDGKFAKKGVLGIGKINVGKLSSKKAFDSYVDKSEKKYSKQQANAAKLYQSPHFYKLNEAIRAGDPTVKLNDDTISLPRYESVFDSTFDIELEEEATLYRGVGEPASSFKVNQEYQNDGYTSTSTVESTARSKFRGPGGAVLHIKAPKGTKVSIPDLVARDITTNNLDEQEAVLARGSSYIVYAIEGDIVYATLI